MGPTFDIRHLGESKVQQETDIYFLTYFITSLYARINESAIVNQ